MDNNNQPINTQFTGEPIQAPVFSQNPNLPNQTTDNKSSKNKPIRLIVLIVILVLAVAGTIATLFLTGVIGKQPDASANTPDENRVEIGDYTVVIDDEVWETSINSDNKTLLIVNKEKPLAGGISLQPLEDGYTYEQFNQGDRLKEYFNNFDEYEAISQTEKNINDSRCIVVTVKYNNVNLDNNSTRSLCENSNKALFFVGVEGINQKMLDSYLETGVEFINTAKHK